MTVIGASPSNGSGNFHRRTNGLMDVVRHFFCVAVIFLHMNSASRYTHDTNLWIKEAGNYIDGAVFGFFALSGFYFQTKKSLGGHVRQQTKRLLVPYFVFSVLYSVLLFGLGKQALVDGLIATVTMHGAGMQLYYLPLLFILNISCAAYIFKRGYPSSIALLFVVLGLIISSIGQAGSSSTGSSPGLYGLYTASFVTGLLIRETSNRRYALVFASIGIGIAFLYGLYLDSRMLDLAGVIFLMILAIQFVDRVPDFRFAGSGGIYLLHTPVANFAISTVLLSVGLTERSNVLAAVLLTYAVCGVFVALLNRSASRYKWLWLE